MIGGSTLGSKIESAATTKSIKIRFFAISNGTDVWIDGLEYVAFGSDLECYLRIHCGLDFMQAEQLSNSSWEVVATDGFAEDLCLSNGKFNWEKYYTINELLNTYSEEVITAAINVGIPLEEIEDKYRGHYKNFKQFATELFDENSRSELPRWSHKFIDYDAVADDYKESYSESEGYVFDAC